MQHCHFFKSTGDMGPLIVYFSCVTVVKPKRLSGLVAPPHILFMAPLHGKIGLYNIAQFELSR